MASCTYVFHSHTVNDVSEFLKVSPEGEGFRPIVETIRITCCICLTTINDRTFKPISPRFPQGPPKRRPGIDLSPVLPSFLNQLYLAHWGFLPKPSAYSKITMPYQIIDLFFDDCHSRLRKNFAPVPRRSNFLIAKLMKKMVFLRCRRMFAEPISIL